MRKKKIWMKLAICRQKEKNSWRSKTLRKMRDIGKKMKIGIDDPKQRRLLGF